MNFCSKPINQKITTTSLTILNLFSESGYLKAQKEEILLSIAENMRDILKKDKSLLKKNYSMFISILDLLQFVIEKVPKLNVF